MHRTLVLVSSLALLGCATTQPAQLTPLPVVSTVAAPSRSLDLRVASLPARPAGAAFAIAGEEHALVRLPAPVIRPATPMPAVAEPPLAARVLAVQAAYRRWCAGKALPGDTALLDRAGGAKLPGAIACTLPPAAAPSQPRALIPGES